MVSDTFTNLEGVQNSWVTILKANGRQNLLLFDQQENVLRTNSVIIKDSTILNVENGQTLSVFAVKKLEVEEVIKYYLNLGDITTA
jgi:hypothetical protein